jgi:hypothetical protein
MTDADVFDRRLADALRDYAVDAPGLADATTFARMIVRNHPRRRGWSSLLPSASRPMRLALTLGLLVLLTAIVAFGVGAWMRDRSLPIRPSSAFPLAVRYGFEGNGPGADALGQYGTYRLDLGGDAIVRIIEGPSGSAHARTGVWGSAEDWIGRAAGYVETGPARGDGELNVRAPAPCGDGSYLVRQTQDGLRLSVVADDCQERVAILTRSPWQPAAIPLKAGELYDSFSFTEPFHFVAATDAHALPWISARMLRLSELYWRVWVFDDVAVPVDVCDASTGHLLDIPATPAAVEAWLRSSPNLPIHDRASLTVDGRRAIALDTDACAVAGDSCGVCPTLSDEFRMGSRLYAVPTIDDTVLVVVWGETAADQMDANTFADGLARSMTFDRKPSGSGT